MIRSYERFKECDSPFERFDRSVLGSRFAAELDLVSRLWFRCGYRPGIGAYLNFFLLRDLITTHDTQYPPRFESLESMAASFYRTDLFIRGVSDSGIVPTGGISGAKVRGMLRDIQERHQRLHIPPWMETYFGFSLLENVEKVCAPLTEEEEALHLSYMSKTYRLMGFPFSDRRELMEDFARSVEQEQAGFSRDLPRHARHILKIGEMIGVPSDPESILPLLPPTTREVFEPLFPEVRPRLAERAGCRLLGRFVLPQAVGVPRKAVPETGSTSG